MSLSRHVVQTGQNSSQGQADERMMQLLRLLNRPLERSPESKRRNLTWYTPIIVPVWPQVKHQGVGAGVLGRGGEKMVKGRGEDVL